MEDITRVCAMMNSGRDDAGCDARDDDSRTGDDKIKILFRQGDGECNNN
ncbi:MAG: hypothetical protein U0U70_11300 [Chitinophagaceae bacterium]